MKKALLTLALTASITSLSAYEYDIKKGWNQFGAMSNITDLSAFNVENCVDYLWRYDNTDETKPIWRLHIANGVDYAYTGDILESLEPKQGFWLKASGNCKVSINAPDLPPAPPELGNGNSLVEHYNGNYKSCNDILKAGKSKGDGTYTIDPDLSGEIEPFEAYCDMTNDEGGWTLIARTNNHFTNEVESLDINVDVSKESLLKQSKLHTLLNNSTHIFKLSNDNNDKKIFVYDEEPLFEPSKYYWDSNSSGKCSLTFNADITNNVWKSLEKNVRWKNQTPDNTFGNHIKGHNNGWMLWHRADAYNYGGGHPCSLGDGYYPTTAALNNIFVK